MKRVSLLLLLIGVVLYGQQGPFVPIPAQQILLEAPAPPPPAVTANYIGFSGNNTFWYWVLANYGGGVSANGSPAIITGAFTLSASNRVNLGWTTPNGAQSFTVVRTTTPNLVACTACLLANATTATSLTDTGGSIGNFTPANPLTRARAVITLNNQDRANPFVTISGSPGGTFRQVPLIAGSFTPGSNAAFDANGNLVDGSAGGGGLLDPGANGFVVRTALNTTVARTLVAGTNVSISNTSGVAGNPTVDSLGPRTVGSGAQALNTNAIGSEACDITTAAAVGVLTTDVIVATLNGSPITITGYIPSTAGTLYIYTFPTANNVNFQVCNNTTGPITPGALTVNWMVLRP